MYDQFVIAVDGSDEAMHAARRGLQLARVFDADVNALYVVEEKALQLTRISGEKGQLRERGEAALGKIEEIAAELGKSITTELTEGKPPVRISEYALEQNADIIVVGRQGLTGVGSRILGGVTEQVLHRSDVPVFVIPGEKHVTARNDDYSRVLIPTDGSQNAEIATQHGLAIAQKYGSEVHVLNVVDLQAAGGVVDAGGLETEFVERLEANGREAVDRVATEIEQSNADVAVQTAVKRTTSYKGTAAGVRGYIEQNEINLVVMGSHGRSNLKRQLLGSVASTVLRTVDVPVLVVNRSD